MIDQQPRDKNKPSAAASCASAEAREDLWQQNMSDPAKASVTAACVLLFCLFMTLQGEIKNIKIKSESGRGDS